MILAAIIIARNPAQYGFELEPESPAEYDAVTLTRPVDLRRVAEWAGTTIDEIQALNPELRRWTTPLKDTQYELKVPLGPRTLVSARLAGCPARRARIAEMVYRQEGRDAARALRASSACRRPISPKPTT